MSRVPTAAVLLIGNELLSGKVQDANLIVLARELRTLGVHLVRTVMVEDDEAVIARDLRVLADSHDWVFTSGGVGPTHDDVTVAAVARAFGQPITREPRLESLLRGYYGAKITEGLLRMADVPAQTELVFGLEEGEREGRCDDHERGERHDPWPTILVRNVFVLPGIPQVFQMKMAAVRRRLGELGAKPFVSRSVLVDLDEGFLKPLLDEVVEMYPDVAVGSYPTWQGAPYRTKLSFDGLDTARVQAASDALATRLDPSHIRGRQ